MKLRFISVVFCLAAASAAHAQSSNGTAQNTNDAQTATAQTAGNPQVSSEPRSWWEPMGGFDFDTNSTGYGWVGPQFQYKVRDNLGIVARAGLNYLYYEFEDLGGRTRVSGPGVNAMVGVRVGGTNWFQVGAGPSWVRRNRELKLTGGGEIDNGSTTRTGVNLNGDVFLQPNTRTTVMGQALYATDDDFRWTRLMAKRQISNFQWTAPFTHSLGGEVISMGNPEFGTVQAGGIFEFLHAASSVSIALRAGWKRQTTDLGAPRTGPYFGIGYWQSLK